MANQIEEQIKALGVAQVIVVLKQPAGAAAAASTLGGHFRVTDTAPQEAIASSLAFRKGGGRGRAKAPKAAAMHVYPNLGLMFGTVDEQGLAALRSDDKHVSQVASAPILSLIRPEVRLAAAKPKTAVTW